MIAEKPAGLLTIGDRGLGGTSFYKIMLEHVKTTSKGKERIYVVHRLDREVSGLIYFQSRRRCRSNLKTNGPLQKNSIMPLLKALLTTMQEPYDHG